MWNHFSEFMHDPEMLEMCVGKENKVKRAIQLLRNNWGSDNRGKGCLPDPSLVGLFVFLIDKEDLSKLEDDQRTDLFDLMGHFGLSATEFVYYRKGNDIVKLEWEELIQYM